MKRDLMALARGSVQGASCTLQADLERLTKPPGALGEGRSKRGAAPKTVRLYGDTLQRSHAGFVRRS
jgi:hypothetical protein